MGQKSRYNVGQQGSLFRVSPGSSLRVGGAAFLSGGSQEESASKFIQVLGKIQFFAVVGLRSLLAC